MTLVRCRDSGCPLRAKSNRAQVEIAGPLAMVAGIAALGLMSFYFYRQADGAAPATPRQTPPPQAESSTITNRDSTSTSEAESFWSWFSGNTSEAHDAAEPDPDAADIRAASRVTTFSCSGNLSASEERVCSNWGLATMDYNLSLLMQSAKAQSRAPDSIQASQRVWQRELDHMGGDIAKVRRHYQQRIESLSKQI